MARIPTHREPTHPGEMLLVDFLEPMGLTQRDLAVGIRGSPASASTESSTAGEGSLPGRP